MKSFWFGLTGSFVGGALIIGLGWMYFHQDIFEVERDGVPKFRVTATQGVTIGSTGAYENLLIETTGTNTVSITADAITVEYVRLASVSVSADIAVPGAGGRDSGLTEAANEWYYLYVITNDGGSTFSALISESSTSPTLPSGFTKKRRVGSVRNDAGSNFLTFRQEGNKILYNDSYGLTRILSDGTAITFTTVSAANFISPTSQRGIFLAQVNGVHSAANVNFNGQLRRTGGGATAGTVNPLGQSQVANVRFKGMTSGDVDTNSSQQIDYKLAAAPDTSGGMTIDVLGYYDRI